MRTLSIVGAIVCFTLMALPAQATITTYDSEASFLAAAGALDFESFETLPPSDTGSDFLSVVSTPNFDVSTSQQFMQIRGDPPVSFAPHGNQVLFWSAETQGTITFDNFGPGIYSFGLYITDWANSVDPGYLAALIFTNDIGDTDTIASTDTGLGDYNDIFFGVVSDTPFTSVSLTTTNNDGWIFFDKVYTGEPVPEPSTFLLMALGLICTAGASRKK